VEDRVSASTRYFLGLETGGTKASAVVMDYEYNQLATREVARPAGATAQDTITQLIELGRAVQTDAGLENPPDAIGWGFGGPVNRRQNKPAYNFHESGWDQLTTDSATQLQESLHAPVYVENDCEVAGLAEAHLGAGSTEGLTFYMTLGSGVGGGIIWNGRILTSGPLGEGEIGHMKVVPQGAQCACGQLGCLEAYCSGWGVGERAMEAINSLRDHTPLMDNIRNAEPRLRAKLLFAARSEDSFAQTQSEEFLNHLADACANVGLLLAPKNFVIGGGLSQLPWLIDELAPRIQSRLPDLMRGHMDVKVAQLGSASVPCGAALYASQRVAER